MDSYSWWLSLANIRSLEFYLGLPCVYRGPVTLLCLPRHTNRKLSRNKTVLRYQMPVLQAVA